MTWILTAIYTQAEKIPPSSLDIRLEEFSNSSLFTEFITKKIDEFGLFTLLVIKCLKQKLATPSSKSAVPRLYLSVDVQQLHEKNSRLKSQSICKIFSPRNFPSSLYWCSRPINLHLDI